MNNKTKQALTLELIHELAEWAAKPIIGRVCIGIYITPLPYTFLTHWPGMD